MKYKIFIASLLLGSICFSCGKKEGGNKGIIAESSSTTEDIIDSMQAKDSLNITSESKDNTVDDVTSYSYKALDGTRAKATFTTDKSGKTLLIEANAKKFQLDFKNKTSNGEVYERNGVSAESKGDSLIVMQDDIEIPLVRVK